jgi:hypothetical protein
MPKDPPKDGRYLAEAIQDRRAGPIRRIRRRLERWVRFARDPAQWSADRYRRSDKLFFAAVLKNTWRDPPTKPPGGVANDEPSE